MQLRWNQLRVERVLFVPKPYATVAAKPATTPLAAA
jgi:hypothetical protein